MMTQQNQVLRYRKMLNDVGRKLSDDDLRSIRFICKAVKGLTKRDLELEDPLEFFEKLEERGVLSYDDTDLLKDVLDMVHRRDCLAMVEAYASGSPTVDGVSLNHREPVQVTSQASYVPIVGGGLNGRPNVGQNGHYGIVDLTDGSMQIIAKTPNVMQVPLHTKGNGMIQQVSESYMGEDLSQAFDIVVEEIGRDWRRLARKLHLTEAEIEQITDDHMRNLREQSVQCLVRWKKKMRTRATKAALVEALQKCQLIYIADRLEGYQFR